MLVLAAAALAVVGGAGADEIYLSEADAPAAVFPTASRFERVEIKSTPEMRARVAARLGASKPTVWEPSYKIATAFDGDRRLGRAVVVEEIGKHRPITLAVGVDADGKVTGIAVMAYREAYGGEIRSRRFLQQYRGKGESDPLLPSQDIQNITGATLSARAVGRAVKKAIAVLREVGDAKSASLPSPRKMARATECAAARVREAHYVMGTILDITVDAPCAETGRAWIRQGVAEARRLDAELSSFRADSALSNLNRSAGGGPSVVPTDLYHVVALSRQLSTGTAGRFDITVSPLVRLWERAAGKNRWPSTREIVAARHAVGAERIRLHAPDRIELPAGAALELGGIGKGYAADRIGRLLRELGATSALVNFGQSSIVAIGPPPGAPPWPIWVRRGEALDGPLHLRDMALSTSASLGRTRRVDGRTIGHIIDPTTGQPLSRSAQATVVASTATEAEAWSKALLIDPAALAALPSGTELGGLLLEGRLAVEDERFAALCDWRSAAR